MSYIYLQRPTFGHYGLGGFSAPPSAEERIRADDFPRVLKILTGPSPWQNAIEKNLNQIHVTGNTFRVVDRKEYGRVLEEVDLEDTGHVLGVTNKKTGVITMLEFFGGSSQATFLGAALHEAVHLVSHPPGGSKLGKSSAGSHLGAGLLEGLVELVSVTILLRQGFTLARPHLGGHAMRVPVAQALVKAIGPRLPGELLFKGTFSNFVQVMNDVFTPRVWNDLKDLTTKDKTKPAVDLIKAKERQLRLHPLVLPKPLQVIIR
ncbi:MAG TPA: hypothetical protein VJM50_23500 [Pyrinomonadaceae bacterium]|nr:hypothetical protein [Pyrinomonadaceae bacterium]